jgi:hypothetical protein
MSHLIEEYSKSLGVKISKPIVSKHFWPVTYDGYITICVDSQIQSRNYKYYNTVIDIIKQSLDKRNIKIIQIGSAKETRLQNVDSCFFDLNFKNFAYVISKSMLHIGVDNVFSHYASSINVPLVTLFGNVYETVSNGYWSKNQISMEAPWKTKPCLGAHDVNDSINKIKPEEIAKSIFQQLGIVDRINMKTKFIGDFYNQQIVEVVPDSFSPIEGLKNHHVFIRCDYVMDQSSVLNWCDYLNSYSIFTRSELDLQFCNHFSKKIKNISYILNKNSSITEQHLLALRNLNIDVTILVEEESDLPEIREKYFDFDVHLYFKADKSLLGDEQLDFSKLFFNSSKVILSKNKKYSSRYDFINGNNSVDKNLNLLDNPVLLEDLQHFYIYERTK